VKRLPRGVRKYTRVSDDTSCVHDDVDAEIEFHIDRLTDELMTEQGLSECDARAEASRMFGDTASTRSACTRLSLRRKRHRRLSHMVGGFVQDLRYGLRALRSQPIVTAATVLTLALGIGANTAVFTVYHSVLLEPFPFEEPEQLVQIWEANPEALARGQLAYADLGVNPVNYVDYRDQGTAFDNMAYLLDYAEDGTVTVGRDTDVAERVGAWSVSGSLFDVLGVRPVLGRTFLESERAPAGDRSGRWVEVVIISNELWRSTFAADSNIIGRRIAVDGAYATVVGVLPPAFQIPPLSQWGSVDFHKADVYLPLHIPAFEMGRRFHMFKVIARLKRDVSVEQAGAELRTIAARLEETHPETNAGWTAEVSPLRNILYRDFGSELTLLMCAAGLVLLIACANVANIQLARGAAQLRAIATRAALGAGRAGVIRHLLAENLLLAAMGGMVGVLIAYFGTQLLILFVPGNLPRAPEAGVSMPAFGVAIVLSLLAGLAFGLAPAVASSHRSLVDALKEGGRSESPSVRRWRVSRLLLPSQVALAVVLLIGSGLLLKSLMRLSRVDRGFDPANVLVVKVHAGSHHPVLGSQMPVHPECASRAAARAEVFREILTRVRELPGVIDATTAALQPLHGGIGFLPLRIQGASEEPRYTRHSEVGPTYFRTMGIPLLRGEGFPDRELGRAGGRVAVVSQTLARTYWPDQNPISKRIGFWECCDLEIVGVVGDVDDRGVDDATFNTSVDPKAVVYAEPGWKPAGKDDAQSTFPHSHNPGHILRCFDRFRIGVRHYRGSAV